MKQIFTPSFITLSRSNILNKFVCKFYFSFDRQKNYLTTLRRLDSTQFRQNDFESLYSLQRKAGQAMAAICYHWHGDQIWRNFAILVTFYKPLANFKRIYLVFYKFWTYFGNLTTSGKFSLFWLGPMLNK